MIETSYFRLTCLAEKETLPEQRLCGTGALPRYTRFRKSLALKLASNVP